MHTYKIERETEADKQMDRQTDKQMDRQTDKQTAANTIATLTYIKQRETERGRNNKIDRQTD
jgi:hypothetical protein